MQLKLVKPQDKDYLWKTYVKSMRAHIEKIWGWELTWQKQDFESNLAKYNTCLIRQNDKTIGYVQYKIDDKQIYINMLILESPQQSQGVGGEILDYLIEENNLTSLSLRCFKVNKRALNFYKKQGFVGASEDDVFYLLTKSMKQ